MGLVVWGSEKLFLGGFDKNKNIFFLKKDSNYFNMIHQNKSLKKLFFMGARNTGLSKISAPKQKSFFTWVC